MKLLYHFMKFAWGLCVLTGPDSSNSITLTLFPILPLQKPFSSDWDPLFVKSYLLDVFPLCYKKWKLNFKKVVSSRSDFFSMYSLRFANFFTAQWSTWSALAPFFHGQWGWLLFRVRRCIWMTLLMVGEKRSRIM